MNKITQRIKAAFLINFCSLGECKDQILDELDMAIYQHRELRDTKEHDNILFWASDFLDAAGIK